MLAIMVINAERWSENNLFLTLFNVSNGDKHISNFSFLNYQIKKYIYIYILGQIQVHGIKLNMCIFKNGPTV